MKTGEERSAGREGSVRQGGEGEAHEPWRGLSGFVSLIFRPRDRGEAEPTDKGLPQTLPTLERIERELQTITDRARAALQDSSSESLGALPAGSSGPPAGHGGRERLRRERDAARGAMEQDVLRLHRQLGTGVDSRRAEKLTRVLIAHTPVGTTASPKQFQDRIESEVLRLLYLRAGEAAWVHLEDILARTGLAWPPPDGLPESTAPEELQRRRELHNKAVRKDFLMTPPRQAAALIHGNVEVWRYGYPARNSYLWLQTALLAVAAALRAEAFAVAVELWLWRSPTLERDILDSVEARLADARSILDRGVHKVSDAVEIAARVDEVSSAVIPQIVWKHAAQTLFRRSWPNWLGRAGVDAPDARPTDPVCGMTLPLQAVVEQFERDGQIFYFCSASCRRQFEGRLGARSTDGDAQTRPTP